MMKKLKDIFKNLSLWRLVILLVPALFFWLVLQPNNYLTNFSIPSPIFRIDKAELEPKTSIINRPAVYLAGIFGIQVPTIEPMYQKIYKVCLINNNQLILEKKVIELPLVSDPEIGAMEMNAFGEKFYTSPRTNITDCRRLSKYQMWGEQGTSTTAGIIFRRLDKNNAALKEELGSKVTLDELTDNQFAMIEDQSSLRVKVKLTGEIDTAKSSISVGYSWWYFLLNSFLLFVVSLILWLIILEQTIWAWGFISPRKK